LRGFITQKIQGGGLRQQLQGRSVKKAHLRYPARKRTIKKNSGKDWEKKFKKGRGEKATGKKHSKETKTRVSAPRSKSLKEKKNAEPPKKTRQKKRQILQRGNRQAQIAAKAQREALTVKNRTKNTDNRNNQKKLAAAKKENLSKKVHSASVRSANER